MAVCGRHVDRRVVPRGRTRDDCTPRSRVVLGRVMTFQFAKSEHLNIIWECVRAQSERGTKERECHQRWRRRQRLTRPTTKKDDSLSSSSSRRPRVEFCTRDESSAMSCAFRVFTTRCHFGSTFSKRNNHLATPDERSVVSSKESLSLSLKSSFNARVLHAQTVLFDRDERHEKGVVVVPRSSSVFDDVIFIHF